MPPHPLRPALSPFLLASISRRLYSSAGSAEALVRVTNLAAPSSGHIRILELNRPQARNAISRALLTDLRAQLDDVHAQYGQRADQANGPFAPDTHRPDPTRALIIASAVDTCFCSGADLKERRSFTADE